MAQSSSSQEVTKNDESSELVELQRMRTYLDTLIERKAACKRPTPEPVDAEGERAAKRTKTGNTDDTDSSTTFSINLSNASNSGLESITLTLGPASQNSQVTTPAPSITRTPGGPYGFRPRNAASTANSASTSPPPLPPSLPPTSEDIDRLVSRSSIVKQHIQQLTTENQKHVKTIKDREDKIATLEKAVEALEAKNAEKDNDMVKADKLCDRQEEEIARLQKEVDELRFDLAGRIEFIAAQKTEIAELHKDALQLRKTIQELEERLSQQKKDMKELEEHVAEQEKDIEERDRRISRQDKRIAKLVDGNAGLDTQVKEMSSKLQELQRLALSLHAPKA